MKYIVMLILLFSLLFNSCENTIYDSINRTTRDPIDAVPSVDSFSKESTVHIRWQTDEGADTYILMRSVDERVKYFSEIYRGEALEFIDTDVLDLKRYIYRLDKMRGNKLFKGTETAIGVCPPLVHDELEANNSKATATFLTNAYQANIFRYEFLDKRFIEDVDYYSVRIPPRAIAHILINQENKSNGEQTYFYVLQEGSQGYFAPKSETAFQIENIDIVERVLSFKVYPNPDLLMGTTIAYTIQLTKIESN